MSESGTAMGVLGFLRLEGIDRLKGPSLGDFVQMHLHPGPD